MTSRLDRLLFVFLVIVLLVGCNAEPTGAPNPPEESAQDEMEHSPSLAQATTSHEPTATAVPPTEVPTSDDASQVEEAAPKTDSPPETWIRHIGGSQDETIQDLVLTDDGDYLILGSSNIQFDGERVADLYLACMKADGSILWEENVSVDGFIHPVIVQEMDEGGYYISGVLASADTDGMDIFGLHLDSERNELSWETFGGPLDEFGAAWPTEDGGYLLGGTIVDPDDVVADPGAAGYGGHAGRSNIYFAKVDAEGNELWSHSFGDELNVQSSGAAPGPDGGFVIVGNIMYYPETGDDIVLLRIDADGEIIWSRTWEEGSTTAFDLLATSDGNYLISGAIDHTDDPGDPKSDFHIIKVDADGNEIWNTTFGDPEMTDYGNVAVEASDGTYVAAGESVVDLYAWDADIAVVKIDENGELLWQELIENDAHTMFSKLLQHPDGGFVIAGSAARNYQFDILLVKTDADGRVVD